MRRFIVELGMGIDLHGQDATKAAQRAVRNAIQHNSLPGLREVGGITDPSQMLVDVTIAVPVPPEQVNTSAVLEMLPYGSKTIRVVPGGMLVSGGSVIKELGDSSDAIIVANACVAVGVPD
jgi:uncharacterized protein (TIGR02058 family)